MKSCVIHEMFCSKMNEKDYSGRHEQDLSELRSGAEVAAAARSAGVAAGGHLAPFISDVVDELDLSGIVGSYESGDGRYGKGVRGDEVPAELARRESRLRKIREAKAALEAEAREDAAASRGQADNGPRTAILR
ncbi:MAG TPA: hypothetical protein VN345_20430 [Blastocatellia bacterium]|nr:hypothetical protein [Blastocatellia bacterium]